MPSSQSVAAIVPMKGHSERVPGKNYRDLAGAPLYAHVLQAVLECPRIDGVFVDTDTPSLGQDVQARFPTVQIIDRPEALHGDFVPMNDILVHDASVIDSPWFLQTHTTNPLVTSKTLTDAIDAMFGAGDAYDSLMSVTRHQTRLWWGPNKPINHNPEELLRTQDLPPVFEENSTMFMYPRELIIESGKRVGANPLFFEMDKIESWDIDEEDDFQIADALVRWRMSR